MLVFIKMIKEKEKDINLIVGDFAGVENNFYCDDVNTLVKFLNIKRNNSDKIYYSSEPIHKDNLNIIYGGNNDLKYVGGNKCDIDSYRPPYPIYDFSNPISNVSIHKDIKIEIAKDNDLLKKVLNQVLKELFKDTSLKAFDNNSEVYNFLKKVDNLETVKKNYNNCKETIQKIISDDLEKSFFYNIILGIDDEYKVGQYVDNMIAISIKMEDFIKSIEKQELINSKIDKEDKSNQKKNSYIVKNQYVQYNSDIKLINNPLTKIILNKDEIINGLFISGYNLKSEAYLPYIKQEYNNFVKFFHIDNNLKKTEIIKRINDNINNFLSNGTDFTIYTSHQHIMNDDKYDIMPIKLEINKNLFNDLFNLYNVDSLKFIKDSQVYSTISSNINVDLIDKNKNKILELQKIYDYIYQIINETHCRLDYGKQICKSRLEEGKFINESLKKVRETINEIIIEKNKDNINFSPNFIDECLDVYCPTHESCFEQNNETTKTENNDINKIPSKIFFEIFKELKYKNKSDFYKDILISVYCVFNISKDANNPPPIPYIDINILKNIFFIEMKGKYLGITEISMKTANDFTYNFDIIVKKITLFYSKVGDLLENDIFKKINDLIQLINNEIEKDNSDTKNNEKKDIEEKDIFYSINEENKKTIKNFINLIDNSNAVSAIGTLEFVDQIAKFNTVNTICSSNSPYLSSNEEYLISSNNMKELYSK
jgi:hypothetical protein